MAEHGFYHPKLGYWQTNSDVSEEIISNYPEGTVEIPIKPASNYKWSGTEWIEVKPSKKDLAIEARMTRDSLLKELDFVVMNPLRWNSFSPNNQEQIATYRQQLLDITQQKSFPISIDWPIKPDFI